MKNKSYATLDDVQTIVAEQIPEGVNLEYKGSSILIERNINALCKAVSAFANSAGGTFIVGIATKDGATIDLDSGTPGTSKRDWIYKIINGNTFPAVETFDIREFHIETGSIYAIEVPPSPRAPHQSNDNKYYKRRGSHSEVMEHYEIDDVRNRPKRQLIPLRAELHTQNILAYLRITNAHETDVISNINCQVDANFKLNNYEASLFTDRGLRSMLPSSTLHFLLGSLIEILQTPEPVVTFRFSYAFHDVASTQSVTFHLADLDKSAILKTSTERALEVLGQKLDKITSQLERLQGFAEALTTMVDGTGMRVSQRTLSAIKGVPQLFDPLEFDLDGYCIIAGLSRDDAYSLHRIFRYFGRGDQAEEQYKKIAPEVRERFEKYFQVTFE